MFSIIILSLELNKKLVLYKSVQLKSLAKNLAKNMVKFTLQHKNKSGNHQAQPQHKKQILWKQNIQHIWALAPICQ
jgi:hypothetical protein